ncbi:sensor histidine kinase [Rubrobacter indicoceani]|uniref:sensor histidine kinase n=1 Tax=Rubrobacter indicoceani TaxID=2051957 RepID=UPI000E5B951F|nr:ATP-binding protein [Rubrobacter indicoceani]
MFLTRDRSHREAGKETEAGASPSGRFSRGGFRPRVGIQVWLTALFMLVTAFAGITAYEIVRPIMEDTLDRASSRTFEQVGEQFQAQFAGGEGLTIRQIQSFAASRGLQWGIVQAETGNIVDGNLDDWDASVVSRAVGQNRPSESMGEVPQGGAREGQIIATYASPINVESIYGQTGTAVVLVKFFTQDDIENVETALENIQNIAIIAFGLAMLISGVSGYVVATLISRRIRRIGLAAERLAAGDFDERINIRLEDEVGALGGTFNSMAVSLMDAFEQVEQEKQRGQAILDGMTDAVVGVNRDLNAVFLNPKAKELLEASDLDFHVRLQEVLAKTRYSGAITEPEAEAKTETGQKIIEIRAAPLEDGALAILRDVTEERHIQRSKAQFIANASHELKTPLAAISGYLELLEDEPDDALRQDFMDEIGTQTRRLQDLARTLLDLSRLDANAVVFREEDVYLEEMLYDVKRDFSYTGRPITIHSTADVPPVETDSTQLYRALTILVDNAIKYSPDGAPVDLDLTRRNGSAVMSVRDRGCGIPEPEIPRIFERFYRAEGSSRADGTGLGLALASEITDHLGGDIMVESDRDRGSRFSIILPLPESVEEGAEPQRKIRA